MSLSVTGRTGVIALAIAGLIAAFAAGYALHPTAPEQVVTAQDARPDDHRNVLYWYDPMVSGQRFDKPGKSPFMDMPLTSRYADQSQDNGNPQRQPTAKPGRGGRDGAKSTLSRDLDAFGTVNIDIAAFALFRRGPADWWINYTCAPNSSASRRISRWRGCGSPSGMPPNRNIWR